MAIVQNNNYYRIVKITKNIVSQTTTVDLFVYKNKELRDLEKSLDENYQNFISKALSRVNLIYDDLTSAINTLKQYCTNNNLNFDEMLFNSQEIRELNHIYSLIANEFNDIKQNLLINEIDINTLKFKDEWISDGLSEDLCVKASYDDIIKFDLNCFTDDLSILYEEIKNKYLLDGEDC